MKVRAIKTIKGKAPMQEYQNYTVSDDDGRENFLICLFPGIEYQEIKGFGGAFTEAASTTLDKLSRENREKIIKLYFDKEEGIGYNIGRVHINSCDFSLGNYACVEENDETLSTFNIERDKSSVIPMIKDAMKYGKMPVFASPWSPPAYMKTNGEMNHGGKLKKEYWELWSEYYVKFVEAYRNEGIDVFGVTVQNEPNATQRWDSCIYSAEEERDFVKNHLGEKMRRIGAKLMFWDHNKERLVKRAKVMLDDPESARYIDGIAVHWYTGDHFEQLDMFHRLYPETDIIFSEGCYEYCKGAADTVKIGEKYAHDMIGNFNNYCNTFCDWNLILNTEGGPNHVGNFCDAPIMADTENDTVYIHDSYYYIGHFSKYVKAGAKRIGSSRYSDAVEQVSFKNPDGSIVSVVLNRTEEEKKVIFSLEGKLIDTVNEPRSISTYIFEF